MAQIYYSWAFKEKTKIKKKKKKKKREKNQFLPYPLLGT